MTDDVDPVAVLIKAWIDWDEAAAAMGDRERRSKGRDRPGAHTLERQAHAKEAAIKALGLDSNRLHNLVADCGRQPVPGRPDGMSVGDALQSALNELLPALPTSDIKEAS